MKKELQSIKQDFLLYTSSNGEIKVSVLLQNETIWLSQKSMAYLLSEKRTSEDCSVIASDRKFLFVNSWQKKRSKK
ncbi:MAG: hypothetical protein U9N76_05730 [Candidatus Marinimicrobia bacterium]|nr:hypothetical protein [Candidatus Neomarinimicrobiota bacterium]